MSYQSKNMNYIFHYEYFQHIYDQSEEEQKKTITNRNADILKFSFPKETPVVFWRKIENFYEISLYTTYPGLLVGTGNPHEIAVDGAIKLGFTFDYVTGHPYITGSTLKGMLRAYFPEQIADPEKRENLAAFISGILGKNDLDVWALEHHIFENNDIFLGAYPIAEGNGTMLEMEYITSHRKTFKNPIPKSLVKVKPDVKFTFGFVLSDYVDEESGEILVSAKEKIQLFRELILAMGIGAKTNVGFGRFKEEKAGSNVPIPEPLPDNRNQNGGGQNRGKEYNDNRNRGQNNKDWGKGQDTKSESVYKDFDSSMGNVGLIAPKCKNKSCSNKVVFNPQKGCYEEYCVACAKENRK